MILLSLQLNVKIFEVRKLTINNYSNNICLEACHIYDLRTWNSCTILQFKYMNFIYSADHILIHYLQAFHVPTEQPAPSWLASVYISTCLAELRVWVPFKSEFCRLFTLIHTEKLVTIKCNTRITKINVYEVLWIGENEMKFGMVIAVVNGFCAIMLWNLKNSGPHLVWTYDLVMLVQYSNKLYCNKPLTSNVPAKEALWLSG